MLHKQICLKHPDSQEQTNQDGTIIYEVPKNKFEMISQQAIWTNYQDMEMLTFFFPILKQSLYHVLAYVEIWKPVKESKGVKKSKSLRRMTGEVAQVLQSSLIWVSVSLVFCPSAWSNVSRAPLVPDLRTTELKGEVSLKLACFPRTDPDQVGNAATPVTFLLPG